MVQKRNPDVPQDRRGDGGHRELLENGDHCRWFRFFKSVPKANKLAPEISAVAFSGHTNHHEKK